MGKGKGNHFQWICPVKIGQIFIEFNVKKNKSFFNLLNLIRRCRKRIPFECRLVINNKRYFNKNLEKKYYSLIKI